MRLLPLTFQMLFTDAACRFCKNPVVEDVVTSSWSFLLKRPIAVAAVSFIKILLFYGPRGLDAEVGESPLLMLSAHIYGAPSTFFCTPFWGSA